MAVAWKAKKLITTISTIGNTLPGDNQVLQRHKRVLVNADGEEFYETERYTKTLPRPKVIQNLFSNFSLIDIHDHYRQGILHLEASWHTKKYWHRMFSTLLGMIFTNSYFLYRHDYLISHNNSDVGMDTFQDFLGVLAYQLIFNPFEKSLNLRSLTFNDSQTTVSSLSTSRSSIGSVKYDCKENLVGGCIHSIRPIMELPAFQAKKLDRKKKWYPKLRCRLCHQPCAHYCVDCSELHKEIFDSRKDVFAIHGLNGDKGCYYQHIYVEK